MLLRNTLDLRWQPTGDKFIISGRELKKVLYHNKSGQGTQELQDKEHKVDDCKVPTLKARLTMAMIKMELLERKASLGKDNSVYLMYIKWMNV